VKTERELAEAFCRIGDPKIMRRFFEEIFTPNERKDLSLRWELMKRLKHGIPQRAIAAELHISLCKITRGAKIVHNPKSVTNRLFAGRIRKKEKNA